MKRILFIGKRRYTNRDAFTERYGRIYQLPAHWAHCGSAVELILVDYLGAIPVESREGSLVARSLPARSRSFVAFAYRTLLRSTERWDLVVGSGDSLIGALALWAARRSGSKFAFDCYDRYDQFPGLPRFPFATLFNWVARQADVRTCASAKVQEFLAPLGPTILIPNAVDSGRFVPMERSGARVRTGLPDGCAIVGYFGSMEPDRGVDDLVHACDILRASQPDLILVLGGRGGDRFQALPGVRYVGNIEYASVPQFIAACDVVAIPYRRSRFMDAGASNKIAEVLACDRPVAATKTPNLLENFPEAARMLGDSLAMCGDPNDLARVIQSQLQSPILVPLPPDFYWSSVASRALQEVERLWTL